MQKIKSGDKSAREEFVFYNMRLVLSIVQRFSANKNNSDDIFQVGIIGLLKSIDNFDTSVGVKFSTYAVPMIIGEIKRYLRDNGLIRVSRSLKDIAYKSIGIKERYLEKYEREATIEEIANELEVEEIDVILAFEAIQDTVSMSTPIYDNGGDVIELIDQISSDEELYENWSKESMIRKAIKLLEPREKEIILDRYFKNKTQTEIAEELGISQAQVSRLEKNALKSMYDNMK
jgi:RNA polymerase sporulation-specific sigma factor